MSRVDEIMRHESEAERLSAEADEHRWEAARLIAEELDAGKSQRTVASEIGKSKTHVGYMASVWRVHHGGRGQSSFDSLYQTVKRGGVDVQQLSCGTTVTHNRDGSARFRYADGTGYTQHPSGGISNDTRPRSPAGPAPEVPERLDTCLLRAVGVIEKAIKSPDEWDDNCSGALTQILDGIDALVEKHGRAILPRERAGPRLRAVK